MHLFKLSKEKAPNCGTSARRPAPAAASESEIQAFLATVPPERIRDLDVRDTLRAGGEPFEAIMEARRTIQPGEVLRLRAIFEPVPLYFVMAAQGLEHWTEQLADDDWRVWFFASPGAEPAADDAAGDQLDVRVIPPREKHTVIFKTFGALQPGGSFVLVNDHDPVPLRYQFEAQHPNGYTWDYLEQGPTTWKVRIGRV